MSTNTYTAFAKYNQEADAKILALLDKLSNDDREKDRGSFYKSLSGLARHIGGGTLFFADLFRTALGSAPAAKFLAPLEKPSYSEEPLDEAQWKKTVENIKAADQALVEFTEALTEADMAAPVKLNWYGGNPESVPLSFMLLQLAAHNTHHRGQVSQILDELKIENDYSAINVAFR
ncbi:MAG: DinB family protein [Treponema sp.]|jgi:uncharacterized damage-inducible protein DinB|nr:DinB family protein [Treponema sp.]